MPRGAILAEMRPDNVLRGVIQELAAESGAYIIVSSAGSTSDTALKNRREAMSEAVNDLPNRNSLALDFYDRTRLATWLRDHPGLIPWVRTKVGRAISGWSSYGPWAYEPDGTSGEYLLDEKLRIHTERSDLESGFPPLERNQAYTRSVARTEQGRAVDWSCGRREDTTCASPVR